MKGLNMYKYFLFLIIHVIQNSKSTKNYTVTFPTPAASSPLQRLFLISFSYVSYFFFIYSILFIVINLFIFAL